MKQVKHYLVVSASDGSARIQKRKPRSLFGLVTYELIVNVPDKWSEVIGRVELMMPEPEDLVTVEQLE